MIRMVNKTKKTFSEEFKDEIHNKGNPNRHYYHSVIMLPAFFVILSSLFISDFGLLVYRILLGISIILSIIAFLIIKKNESTMYDKNDKLKAYKPMFITNVFFFLLGSFISQAFLPNTILLEVGSALIIAISILVFAEFSLDYKKLVEPYARGLLLMQTLFALGAVIFSLNLILFGASSIIAKQVISSLYLYSVFVLMLTFIEITAIEIGVAGI